MSATVTPVIMVNNLPQRAAGESLAASVIKTVYFTGILTQENRVYEQLTAYARYFRQK
ncbi:hypothetical protein [Serratia sp. FGI94]|uniref:hypothetical protein n=1 Tax=Serratia sp. FGI94 TaxID=671990 RepID=UPI0018F53ED0|nr:hypothetical protein [Serratia sp. FGI94]